MAISATGFLHKLSSRVIDAGDSDEQKLHKTLLIFACGLMGFAAMLWLVIYHAMGIRYSATVPLLYLAISAATLAIYLWKLNFEFFRFAQTSLYLFVPFIMQWSIGSYVTSSGVMLWALLAPIGVMIFQLTKLIRRHCNPMQGNTATNRETEVTVRLEDGRLLVSWFTGQQPISLMPVDQTTFRPVGLDDVTITFKVEGDRTVGYTLKQGSNTMEHTRITEAQQ